ncbi:MAG: nitroreductase family protein [Geminicoccaceae bacterium]
MPAKDDLTYQPIPLPDRPVLSDDQMGEAASAFHDNMRKRHSIRQFSSRPVPRAIIEQCIHTAGTAPSGANHQPWHFVALSSPSLKSKVREAAEKEERAFYAGGAGDEWLKALEPIGTGASKPHLDIAPWLIVIFAQRYGHFDDGTRYKNYYVPESVGIATGFLIAALHNAGLSMLTHTPNPMRFLNDLLGRPDSEKPVMILAVGHPADDAVVPSVAKIKKPLEAILTVRED